MDGFVGHVLSVVDAAEKQTGLGVARFGGEDVVEAGERFIDATLLEKTVGLRCIGQKMASAEQHAGQQKKGECDADACRDIGMSMASQRF